MTANFGLKPGQKPTGDWDDDTDTYRVAVAKTEHGKVTVRPKWAEKGEKVTITAAPDEGYGVESVTVTDAGGKKPDVRENRDGTCGRTDDVTREQLAAILYRYAVWNDWTIQTASPEASDGDAVSDRAAEAVRWAVANGILAADEAASARPGEAATRAEIAHAIRAFLEMVENKKTLQNKTPAGLSPGRRLHERDQISAAVIMAIL